MTETTEEPKILAHIRANGGLAPKLLPDGRVAWLCRYNYTWGIHVATPATAEFGYDERWCFHDAGEAALEFIKWDGTGEPGGWHRHIPSGRRREDGDPLREYINP